MIRGSHGITLADLLTMASGLRYEESSFPFPWGDDTYTYYGTDLRSEALDRTEVEGPPGERWHYNNYNPLLLGLVLERATGESVSEQMSRRLWRPLGAASDASWSLDSDESGFEKLESGVNATALDYARFGLLFLHGGRWNGRRIVSRRWVRCGDRRPDRYRLPEPVRIHVVGGRRPATALLRIRQLRPVRLRRARTRASSSSVSAAIGGAETKPGWRCSATSPTSSAVRARAPVFAQYCADARRGSRLPLRVRSEEEK